MNKGQKKRKPQHDSLELLFVHTNFQTLLHFPESEPNSYHRPKNLLFPDQTWFLSLIGQAVNA